MNLILIIGLSACVAALLIYFQKRNIFKKLKKLRSYWGLIPEDAIDIETAKLFFKLKKSNLIQTSPGRKNRSFNFLENREKQNNWTSKTPKFRKKSKKSTNRI